MSMMPRSRVRFGAPVFAPALLALATALPQDPPRGGLPAPLPTDSLPAVPHELEVGKGEHPQAGDRIQVSALPRRRAFSQAMAPCAEQQALRASDGASADRLGSSVAVVGDIAVIGALGEDDGPLGENGAAYVFERTGGSWTEELKLLASDKATGDFFGSSISMSGDTLVVGAPGQGDGGLVRNGAAYVFVRVGGSWLEQQKLLASDRAAGDAFGSSVSISGDTIVVGAPLNQDASSRLLGAAYVFVRNGGVWTEQQELWASDGVAYDAFGHSVSVSGDTAVVGAPEEGGGGLWQNGAAYVFVRAGGSWSEQQKLLAADRASLDNFGMAVSVSGDTAFVGAPQTDVAMGATYVFGRIGGVWGEQQRLISTDRASFDWFGASLSLSDDRAVVGTHARLGASYVYLGAGGAWIAQQVLLASDHARAVSVSVSGDTVVIGSEGTSHEPLLRDGAAFVFTCSDHVGPTCDAGPDVVQECDGVSLSLASVDDPNGGPLTITWTSSCDGTVFAPSADVIDPFVTFGGDCGVTCELTLAVDDGSGALPCTDVVNVTIGDTTPPVVEALSGGSRCLWAPNHRWSCLDRAAFHPVVSDDCPDEITWRFTGCASDQPADDGGDGSTDPDCVVSSNGEQVCVRAERQGRAATGRQYAVSIVATDACGNEASEVIGTIRVPRDQRLHEDCLKVTRAGRRPNRGLPF